LFTTLDSTYRFDVKSSCGRVAAVVDVTVISPRAPMVYTRPATKDTPVRDIAFADEPA
jgi:hypothetical protein